MQNYNCFQGACGGAGHLSINRFGQGIGSSHAGMTAGGKHKNILTVYQQVIILSYNKRLPKIITRTSKK